VGDGGWGGERGRTKPGRADAALDTYCDGYDDHLLSLQSDLGNSIHFQCLALSTRRQKAEELRFFPSVDALKRSCLRQRRKDKNKLGRFQPSLLFLNIC